jgi:hypothetical protein
VPIKADPKRAVVVTVPNESVLQRSRAGSLTLIIARDRAVELMQELQKELGCDVQQTVSDALVAASCYGAPDSH